MKTGTQHLGCQLAPGRVIRKIPCWRTSLRIWNNVACGRRISRYRHAFPHGSLVEWGYNMFKLRTYRMQEEGTRFQIRLRTVEGLSGAPGDSSNCLQDIEFCIELSSPRISMPPQLSIAHAWACLSCLCTYSQGVLVARRCLFFCSTISHSRRYAPQNLCKKKGFHPPRRDLCM